MGNRPYLTAIRRHVGIFGAVFVIEVVVEIFGYQMLGKGLIGRVWDSPLEPWIHSLWLLVVQTPILWVGIAWQLRRQRRVLEALRDRDSRFRSLFQYHSAAVLELDRLGVVTNMNQGAIDLWGRTLDGWRALSAEVRWDALGGAEARSAFALALLGETTHVEGRWGTPGQTAMTVDEIWVPIVQSDAVVGAYVLATDTTERHTAQQRLWHMAHHDERTQLPNRTYLEQQLKDGLVRANETGTHVGVLFVNLDRFRYINDAINHWVGDQVLRAVSERLKATVGDDGFCARFGGDEFAVLVSGSDVIPRCEALADRILVALREPIRYEVYEFLVTASIGLAAYPLHGDTATALLRSAATATEEAKRQGKDQYQVYLPSTHATSYQRLRLEQDLRTAFSTPGQLFLEYQPHVDLATKAVVGGEALMRWKHPVLGLVSPGEFIPLAEEGDLIVTLGQFVLRSVCRQLRTWIDEGRVVVPISINVSPLELSRPLFVDTMLAVLREFDIPGHLIAIEITESALMRDAKSTRAKLEQLQGAGIHIYLDDFGKGYSALGYLAQYPVDVIKIDAMFVREIDRAIADASIAAAVIEVAHARQIRVIAEGVERATQADKLLAHHCDSFQGFWFSPPVPAATFGSRYLPLSTEA